MQVNFNSKNTFTFLIALGFIYLAYLIFFGSDDGFPEIDIDLKDIVSYAVLAVEMGGIAVQNVQKEHALNVNEKGLTAEGKTELLTQADLISNYLILDVLERFPRLKIVSEEKSGQVTDKEANRYRVDSYSLWLSMRDILDKMPSRRFPLSDVQVFVDPLDATQEFTENLTEYVTVMVCIAVGDEPVFGAIFRPFHNQSVFGLSGWGVMTSTGEYLKVVPAENVAKTIVVSRSHAGSVEQLVNDSFGEGHTVEAAGGSGYKTLRVVNGTAELYVHRTAIKKWDTCAGDAILRAMGGSMLDFDGMPLKYGESTDVVHKNGLVGAAQNPYTYYKKISPHLKP